jgi:hypothetical protein
MLPLVSNLKTKLIAGAVAVALLANSAAPAMAWGKDEQNMAKGALAVLLLGAIMRDADHHARVNKQRAQQQPVYHVPYDRDPVDYYEHPRHREPVYQPPQQSYYNTPAAMAFNAYSGDERRRIQGTLANYGYYNGRVDGSFGPSTYRALTAYASQTGKMAMLETRGGAFGLMDGLLY